MKNALFTISLLFLSTLATSPSFAGDTKFACSGVYGEDEYTIYIDLEKPLAGFFDNDSTSLYPLKKVRSLESMPPQTQYTFEAIENRKLTRVVFNVTRMTASITWNAGTSESSTHEAEHGCVVEPDLDLDL